METQKNKIIILSMNNSGQQLWQEIEESELKRWMKDGSIRGGDRIVYPRKEMEVVEIKTLGLQEKK